MDVFSTSYLISSETPPPITGDVVSPFISNILGSSWLATLLTLNGILNLLDTLWSIYTVLAYLAVVGMLYLYVFATMRYNQLEEKQDTMVALGEQLWNQQYRGAPGSSRLADVLTHIESDRPNDWKLAIIEADIILDDILKQRGFAGSSLGERLRGINPDQMASLQDAWDAHKVRNQIAHGGADFVLTHRLAEETIKQYRRVFSEFGVQ